MLLSSCQGRECRRIVMLQVAQDAHSVQCFQKVQMALTIDNDKKRPGEWTKSVRVSGRSRLMVHGIVFAPLSYTLHNYVTRGAIVEAKIREQHRSVAWVAGPSHCLFSTTTAVRLINREDLV